MNRFILTGYDAWARVNRPGFAGGSVSREERSRRAEWARCGSSRGVNLEIVDGPTSGGLIIGRNGELMVSNDIRQWIAGRLALDQNILQYSTYLEENGHAQHQEPPRSAL